MASAGRHSTLPGGWGERANDQARDERLRTACAEWADGESVGAHIAYRNDVLCTNDFGRATGRSVFDMANRAWLAAEFGVAFRTVGDLVADLAVDREQYDHCASTPLIEDETG